MDSFRTGHEVRISTGSLPSSSAPCGMFATRVGNHDLHFQRIRFVYKSRNALHSSTFQPFVSDNLHKELTSEYRIKFVQVLSRRIWICGYAVEGRGGRIYKAYGNSST